MDYLNRPDNLGRMTAHAVMRCNQRGITASVAGLVLAHFDRDCRVGDGATAISITRAGQAELRTDGVPTALVEKAGHVILILDNDDGAIITAINRSTWFARFHHGADRLGHRRRPPRRCRNTRSPR